MKISDFTNVPIPINPVAYLHFVDVSEANPDDQNKKVQIDELIDGSGLGFSLEYQSQITVSNAEVLALNTTPKQILAGSAVSPNYTILMGLMVEYFYVSAAFATDTNLIIVDANGVQISESYDILGNTSNKKLFMLWHKSGGKSSYTPHGSTNFYLTTPTSDPTAGGGFLNVVPISKEIITF